MRRTAFTLATVGLLAGAVGHAPAVRPTSCGERMEGVFTGASGGGHAVRLHVSLTYPGFDVGGRFRCLRSRSGPCVVREARVDGIFRGDDVTTRYQLSLSRGHGDTYRLLCNLEGTAPFLFGLYLPALEGTYSCDDGQGGRDEGTFQLVGVGKGRCR
jgi:hypothetical protein